MNKEVLRMKFVFDKQKLKEYGLNENYCLKQIRDYASKHNLVEIEKGVFDSSNLNNTEPFFFMIMKLPYTNWFLKVIKEWKFYFDNDIEDCIKSYNDVVKRNA